MDKQPIVPEDLYRYRLVAEPAGRPGTLEVAYVVKQAVRESNDYHSRIRLAGPEAGADRPLTDGPRDSAPAWSPDGSRLAFIRQVGSQRQLWTVAADPGSEPMLAAEAAVAAGRSIVSFDWSPDGRQLVYSARVAGDELLPGERAGMSTTAAGPRGASYDRTVPRAEGAGWWDGKRPQLFLLELASGDERQLTRAPLGASDPAWSPDGSRIAYLSKAPPAGVDPDLFPFNDLFTVDLASGEPLQETDSTVLIQHFGYSRDGSELRYVGDDRIWGSGTHNRLYSVPAVGGGSVTAWSACDMQLGNYILNDVKSGPAMAGPLSAADGSVYVVATREGSAEVYRFAAGSGEPQQIGASPEQGRDVYQLALAGDGRSLLACIMDPSGPGELYRIDPASGEQLRLTGWNDELMQQRTVIKPQPLWYESEDGMRLQGWLLLPDAGGALAGSDRDESAVVARTVSAVGDPGAAVVDASAKLPLVLVIHGGPHAMYAPAYSHELQQLAAQGFAVLFVNPRGSFGYGQEQARACRGDFGGGDYRDLMTAVDAALARWETLDAGRLGVMGGSYGGLMTNWIISHTDRFRVAVSQRGISNWLSFYGTSDIGLTYTDGIAGANPWSDPQLLWERSPLAYADQVKTPTLVMHGEQDLRCPVEQSDQWYTALRRHGVTARLIRYPGAGHSFLKLGKPSLRLDALEQTNVWLHRHLTEEGRA
ncbi:peptidase [Paenibacillus sp. 598K]|uniref:S9 family peptidase n=1 Tax=Paenibacillus sp. 598K TaxID=1117987 RepID=UPI000FFA2FEA|nr:S9 family peptidase [Paenibacillus sp. 598K]GBF75274.1 peptidase [Paenibacillus sp. 598K]